MLLYLMWSTFCYCWSKSDLKISLYIKSLSGHLLVKVGVNDTFLFPMNAQFGERPSSSIEYLIYIMKYSWSRNPFFTIFVIRDLNSPLDALSDWGTNFELIIGQVYRSALSVACLLFVSHGQMMYNQGHSIRHPLCFQLAGRKHHGPHGLYHSWFSDSLPLF